MTKTQGYVLLRLYPVNLCEKRNHTHHENPHFPSINGPTFRREPWIITSCRKMFPPEEAGPDYPVQALHLAQTAFDQDFPCLPRQDLPEGLLLSWALGVAVLQAWCVLRFFQRQERAY